MLKASYIYHKMGDASCTAGCGTNLGAYQRYHAPERPTEGSRTVLLSATRQYCEKPRRGSQNKMASRLSRATAQTPSHPLELPAGLLPCSTAADRHQHGTVTQACRFVGSLVANKHGKQLKHQKFRRKAYSAARDCAARAISAPLGEFTAMSCASLCSAIDYALIQFALHQPPSKSQTTHEVALTIL